MTTANSVSKTSHVAFEPLEERVLLSAANVAAETFATSPAVFVQNAGQWTDPSVRYAFERDTGTVSFTDAGPVYTLFSSADGTVDRDRLGRIHAPRDIVTSTFSTTFDGANLVTPVGLDPTAGVYNFFVGDSSTWRTDVPGYSTLAYYGLYSGIDLYLSGQPTHLKYEFHLAAGADPGTIAIDYSGVKSLSIDANGALVVETDQGTLTDDAPVMWQTIGGQRVAVSGAYTLLDDHTVGFTVTGTYNRGAELVIDPLVFWTTLLGGTGSDTGYGVDIDPRNGDIVTTGWTSSNNFTGKTNNYVGNTDGFVAKLNNAGVLQWMTYVGGSDTDESQGIGVDTSGNIFIGGDTFSDNLPLATNAINIGTGWGSDDAWVTKLSSGGAIVWSTYVGGSWDDNGDGLTVDVFGNALLQAETFCDDVPFAVNASPGGGSEDGLVAKVNTSGQIVWTAYIGGSDEEDEYGIYTDSSGSALVTGFTCSYDFVGITGTNQGGYCDAYVAKLNANGYQLWAVDLGGSDEDVGNMITADAAGNVIITGYSYSGGFNGVYNTNGNFGGCDAFAAKLSATGVVQWVTFIGGSGYDVAQGIGADLVGNTIVAGYTDSTDFSGALNSSLGWYDVFVAKVSPSGVIVGSVYIGGSNDDEMWGDAIDVNGSAVISGTTWSTDFVGATNANRGSGDAFVSVVNFDIPPTVTTTGSVLSYLQAGGPAVIDPNVTVTDPDTVLMYGATVWVSTNFAAGQDVLGFANQNGITGSYNAATGILQLVGWQTPAVYAAALRTITYNNTSATPSLAMRTVMFAVTDGISYSNNATRSLTVTPDAASVVTTTGTALAYLQANGTAAVDPGVTVTDSDSVNLGGAWVWISGNYDTGKDVLSFTNQNGIFGSWSAATGILTMSGSSSVANYQAALRSVLYNNASSTPSLLVRTFSFKVNDGVLNSNTGTRNGNFTPDTAPVVATTGSTLAYLQAAGWTAVDPGVTIADVDSAFMGHASVWISGNYANGQDVLSFTNQNGITGAWTASTGVMALTGVATLAQYQAALESVSYRNTSATPSLLQRTFSFRANDGVMDSNIATRAATFTADVAPVATATGGSMSYPSNAAWLAVDSGFLVTDSDSATMASATATIAGGYLSAQDSLDVAAPQAGIIDSWNASTGTLTMTGAASLATWLAELRSVSYYNSNPNPSTAARTVSFVVNDGVQNSNTATRGIAISLTNVPPSDVTLSNASVNEDLLAGAAVGALGNNDPDPKEAYTYTLVGGYGDNALFQVSGATLQTAAPLDYETMAHAYSVEVRVADNGPGNPTFDKIFTITLVDTEERPVLTPTATPLDYSQSLGWEAVDSGILVTDADNANLAGATVSITGNFAAGQDLLSFVNQNGITGSYNAATGVMTLAGSSSVANYQAALRSVAYADSAGSPSLLQRTITFQATDGTLASWTVTRLMNVMGDIPPVVTPTASPMRYVDGDGWVLLDSGVAATDLDSATLNGASIWISSGYVNGQDVLGFVNQNGITGSWDAAAGRLTLSGASSVANYQTALRSIGYYWITASGTPAARTVSYQLSDALRLSNTGTRTINIARLGVDAYEYNDASWITTPVTLNDSGIGTVANASIFAATGTDIDWFRFTVPYGATGSVTITVGNVGGGLKAHIGLYDSALGTLADQYGGVFSTLYGPKAQVDGSTANGTVTLTYAGLTAGSTWYIKVAGNASTHGIYDLTVNTAMMAPDALESNNTAAAASNPTGTLVAGGGACCLTNLSLHRSADEDWFRIDTPANTDGNLVATVSHLTGGVAGMVWIYQHYTWGDGVVGLGVYASWTPGGAGTATVYNAQPNTTYYVRVDNFWAETGGYQLDVTLPLDAQAKDAYEGGAGNNVSWLSAPLALTGGAATVNNLSIHNNLDQDWFSFMPTASGTVTITVSGVSGGLKAHVGLYDSVIGSLADQYGGIYTTLFGPKATQDAVSANQTVVLSYSGLHAYTTYYVKVSDLTSTSGLYTLNLALS